MTESNYGIVLRESSNIEIENNNIENLLEVSLANAAIAQFSTGVPHHTSGTIISKNNIRNVPRGIDSFNSEFVIKNNEIDLSEYTRTSGVIGRQGFNQEIYGNTIIANNPIFFGGSLEMESDNWDIDIHDNIELRSVGGIHNGATISLSNGSASVRIEDNNILYGDTRFPGIRALDWTGESLIFDNPIDRSTVNFFPASELNGIGIHLENSSNFQVIDNRINTENLDEPIFITNRSMFITGCANIFFCCNTVNNSRFGVDFWGANSVIDLNTTQFGDHTVTGLNLNNADIGDQIASGNDFSNSTGQFYARYIGEYDIFLSNNYQSQEEFWPDGLERIGVPPAPFQPGDWFQSPIASDITDCDINTSPNNQNACGVPFNEPLSPPQNPGEIGQIDINISNADIQTSNAVKNGVYYEYKRQLYQRLKDDQVLLGQNNNVSNFYANQQQTNSSIDQFYLQDKELTELSDLTYFFGSSFTDIHSDIKNLNHEIEGFRQQLKYASSQSRPAISASLLSAIGRQNHEVKKLDEKIEYAKNQQSSAYQSLLSQNSSTVASEVFEQNQKNFNQVYLELLIADNLDLNAEQKTIIDDLAFQCYYAGGRAVMQARTIQRINGSYYDYDEYDEDCKSDNKAELKSENTTEIANKIIIAPNPTTARFTVDLGRNLEQSGSYRLVNPYGKVIQTGELEEEARRFSLDLSGNHPGIYYLEIKGLDYTYYLKKIVLTPDY